MTALTCIGTLIGRGGRFQGPGYPTGVPSAFDRIASATTLAVAWEDSNGEDDARGGKVLNGFFFPAHAIVEVDGQEYGYPFAPRPRGDR